MALLTAEDVLNKAFSKTKYREGFDQDEVDDFLDEVANTIAQLTAERDEFAARVANGVPDAAEAPPATAAGGVPGTTGLLAAATEPGGVNPTGMLAMAQKLHDEYVQAGEAERDRIIADANVAADEIRDRADGEAKARMDTLSGERSELEARIDDLRRFERDYRARLKTYLENLLGDLDHAGVAGTGAGVGAAAGFAAAELGDDAPAGEVEDAGFASAPDAYIVEDVVVADVYESEDGETEVVVVEEFETVTPVSFDEALGGYEQPTPYGDEAAADSAPADSAPVEFAPEGGSEGAFEPAQPVNDEPAVETPPAPPSYDATQSWESQLRPQGDSGFSNPFAPVTEPEAPAEGEVGEVPAVDAPDESDEAPYTPPSSRMFTDLYGQQRPESEK